MDPVTSWPVCALATPGHRTTASVAAAAAQALRNMWLQLLPSARTNDGRPAVRPWRTGLGLACLGAASRVVRAVRAAAASEPSPSGVEAGHRAAEREGEESQEGEDRGGAAGARAGGGRRSSKKSLPAPAPGPGPEPRSRCAEPGAAPRSAERPSAPRPRRRSPGEPAERPPCAGGPSAWRRGAGIADAARATVAPPRRWRTVCRAAAGFGDGLGAAALATVPRVAVTVLSTAAGTSATGEMAGATAARSAVSAVSRTVATVLRTAGAATCRTTAGAVGTAIGCRQGTAGFSGGRRQRVREHARRDEARQSADPPGGASRSCPHQHSPSVLP